MNEKVVKKEKIVISSSRAVLTEYESKKIN